MCIPSANRDFRFGLGKCSGGARCSAYKGWWNQPQRLVRSAHPTTWWDRAAKRLVRSTEWIAMAIVFVHSICESRLSIGLGKCSGGARGFAPTKDGQMESTPKAGAHCAPYIMCTLHIAIAVIIHSFDSHLQRMVESTPKANAHCAPYIMCSVHIAIAVIIHSFDRTVQEINPKGWCAVRTLQLLQLQFADTSSNISKIRDFGSSFFTRTAPV